jgi:two-component system, response regulator / RNA-binding antiterminator
MKILVADCDVNHAQEFSARLQALDDNFTVTLAVPGENLLACVRAGSPDVIIAGMARPDRDGLESVCSLYAAQDDPQFMEQTLAAGLCIYHAGGVTLPVLQPILRMALAVFQRMRADEQAETRKTIDTAKRLLMTQDNMTEPMAHRYLQRRAMTQQKKLKDAALGLLRERDATGDASPE